MSEKNFVRIEFGNGKQCELCGDAYSNLVYIVPYTPSNMQDCTSICLNCLDLLRTAQSIEIEKLYTPIEVSPTTPSINKRSESSS